MTLPICLSTLRSQRVSQFLNWHPHRETEEAKSWIASKLARAEVDDLLLGMELRESSKLIGTVRAYHFDAVTSSCEISYALNPLYQGCGYMGEALRCLVDTCFEAVGGKEGRCLYRLRKRCFGACGVPPGHGEGIRRRLLHLDQR